MTKVDHAPILQQATPYSLEARPLPGTRPLEPDGWITVDEAFAAQMAQRDALLSARPEAVLYQEPDAAAAAEELLEETLALLARRGDFGVGPDRVRRPDGITVPVNRAAPMATLGRLVQEDLCLMLKRGEEHVLSAAVLCFPASWSLEDKAGRPLTRIHDPVAPYDAGMARRVQRLFDGVRPGRPLWRFNALPYASAELHQPRREGDRRDRPADPAFLRSERQAILRLPRSEAVVFAIHTYVLARPAGS